MRFPIKITDNFLIEPVLHTFGVKPETSFVAIEGDTLEVSMGRWFNERISLHQIAAIAPSEWPWWGGLGVKLYHHGIAVVGSTEHVVNIKFTSPQKLHVVGVIDAEQLWVSIEDREAFLEALAAATKLTISEHAKF